MKNTVKANVRIYWLYTKIFYIVLQCNRYVAHSCAYKEEKKLWDVQQQIKSEAGDNEINIKLD